MKKFDLNSEDWIMCYPHGSYNNDSLRILKNNKCLIGLTTNPGLANLDKTKLLELKRFDCNSFPQ